MRLLSLLRELRSEYQRMLLETRHGERSLTPLLCEIWDLNPAIQNNYAECSDNYTFIKYPTSEHSGELEIANGKNSSSKMTCRRADDMRVQMPRNLSKNSSNKMENNLQSTSKTEGTTVLNSPLDNDIFGMVLVDGS